MCTSFVPPARDAVEIALPQWKFKPRTIEGNAWAIKTGLLIEFTPAGGVKYSTGD
jgi:hypothetical protein